MQSHRFMDSHLTDEKPSRSETITLLTDFIAFLISYLRWNSAPIQRFLHAPVVSPPYSMGLYLVTLSRTLVLA